jgi:hypothetical protein
VVAGETAKGQQQEEPLAVLSSYCSQLKAVQHFQPMEGLFL